MTVDVGAGDDCCGDVTIGACPAFARRAALSDSI